MQKVNGLSTLLLDLLFPQYCIACGSIGTVLCEQCLSAIPPHDPACIVCGMRNKSGTLCSLCKQRAPHITRVLWAAPYDSEPVHSAITKFKYHAIRALVRPLTACMVPPLKKHLQGANARITEWVLVPVPLHRIKQRARGFNQAELLAKELAGLLSVPLVKNALIRIKNTPAQAHLRSHIKRRENMSNAFEATGLALLTNKTVLLVDDVATTGSTLNDAARALRAAGAREVWGIVVARG
jgi:competence protein ComFC